MDRIFSARVDESLVAQIRLLAKRLHTSQKNVLESAIRIFSDSLEGLNMPKVFDETCGAWTRKGSPDALRTEIKTLFHKGMGRHHR